MSLLTQIRAVVWGKPAETKAERRLIVKIDFFILSYVCLMYWVNYLDRSNLNNAYVSGMREDLKFQGNQLNIINTVFYAGYCVGQVPNNLMMQKVTPRIWLTFTCLAWGLLTLGTGFVHHPWEIMIIRFFQAIFESSTFVGTHWILGSWYNSEELGKRTAIFTSCGLAGTMFSGFLQGGIYTTLNGKKGLSGWRWLFVIDFLITLPIAAYGYFCFPDTPSSSTARYLSAEERALAISRLPAVTSQRGVLGWKRVLRVILGSWQWWGFSFIWCVASNTEMFSTNAIMNLWLQSTGNYTTAQVNYIPTAVSGMGILATLVLGWYTDLVRRSYWHVGIFLSFTATISGAIMLNPPTRGAKFFALILNGCQYASQTTMFAWANHLCRHDDAKRTVVLASMNMFAIAVYMFWSLVFYNVSQAPTWFAGSIAMICMAVALFLTTIAIHLLEKKQLKTERLTGLEPPDEASVIEQAIDAETKLG